MGVVKKPAEGTRAVLAPPEGPALRGEGDIVFVCGGCRAVLIDGMAQGQVQNIVVRCPDCGAHNETLD